jgi:hypothetical protein
MFGQGFKISEVRAAQVGSDGKEINAKTTPAVGNELAGSAGSTLPPEVALCISFWSFQPGTFQSHPGQRRGRMYLPYIAATRVDAQGMVANPQTVADGWATFFNDVQGAHAGSQVTPGNDWDYWQLHTVSRVAGESHQVEVISCDNHFDSQRRRQHQTTPVKSLATIDH